MIENIVNIQPFLKTIKEDIIKNIAKLKNKYNINPCFLTIMVGDNSASLSYIKSKNKLASELGITNDICYLSSDVSSDKIISIISKANDNINIHGILLQLPLPKHLDEKVILQKISPNKDVDGLHQINMMKFIASKTKGILSNSFAEDFFIPCTPFGCINLLHFLLKDLESKNAVVLGRSNLVGYPLFNLLLNNNCTTTITHSKTKDLDKICKNADILCVAIGKPKFITSDYVKKGATILDIGVSKIIETNKKAYLSGDVDLKKVIDEVSFITPVPKGIGPITVMFLMVNVVKAACLSVK